MINYFKKVVAIKNAFNSTSQIKGLVIVESLDDKTTLNFNFSGKLGYDYTLFISGEEKDIKVEKVTDKEKFKIVYQNFKVSLGFCVALFNNEELICYGIYGKSFYDINGITSYAKKKFKENGKEQNFKAEEGALLFKKEGITSYDDECIAEENYYELNDEPKSLYNQDVALHQTTKKAEKIEENEVEFGKYETDLHPFERGDFYEKIKDKLDDLFVNFEQCNDLNERLPNGKFVKIHYAENKFYYVGKIYENSQVKFICYGVERHFNEIPNEILDKFSFIPLSNYDLKGKGFCMIFQEAKTGEIIKKQD